MADADDSYDLSHIAPFIEKLKDGCDLVMGCRFPKGGGRIMKGAMPWKHRWIGNPVLSWIGRLFFESPVMDFHCGMRAFTREAYQQIALRTTGMEFASEMVIKATLQGIRIGEVPTTLYKDGRSRPPHLKSWRDGWRHLRFMLLYSLFTLERGLFLGLLILLAGLFKLIMAVIYWGEASFGAIPQSESLRIVIPAVTFIVIGIQIIFSSFFLSILDLPRK